MSKKQNNKLEIGVDTLTLDIPTEYELLENAYDFVSDRTNNIIGTLTKKTGKTRGYRLNLNLPKCLYDSNTKPLTEFDFFHFKEIVQMVEKQMVNLFGENYPTLFVSVCEVNSTVTLEKKENVEPMLNMIAHMLLQKNEKVCLWCTGVKTGRRYDSVCQLKSGMQVESIKTQLLSNDRMALKIYDKQKERQKKEQKKGNEETKQDNTGKIRFEIIYNKYGLSHAKAGQTLEEFLTVSSIKRLLDMYRKDYKIYFINKFWGNSKHSFYKECITIIYNDFKRFCGKPTTVALINKQIIEWDYAFFCKAAKQYYEKSNSADKAIKRVRNCGELQINEGVVDAFVQISKAIINGN